MFENQEKQNNQAEQENHKETTEKLIKHNPEVLMGASLDVLDMEGPLRGNLLSILLKLTKKQEGGHSEISTDKIEGQRKKHESFLKGVLQKEKEIGGDAVETEDPENLVLIHCTDFLPESNEDDNTSIRTSFSASGGEKNFTSVHFSVNHASRNSRSMSGELQTWAQKNFVVLSPYSGFAEKNGPPTGFLPEDCWWGKGCDKGVDLPEGTIILYREGQDVSSLKDVPGITLIESDDPFEQSSDVLEKIGTKQILPDEFQNPNQFSINEGTLLGHHDPFAPGSASEHYRNLGIVSENMVDSSVGQLVAEFNSLQEYGSQNSRFEVLVNLFGEGYFENEGVFGVSLPTQGIKKDGERFNLVRDFLKTGDEGNIETFSKVELIKDFREKLLQLSQDFSQELPQYSFGYLANRINHIKKIQDSISPETAGLFLASRLPSLIKSVLIQEKYPDNQE